MLLDAFKGVWHENNLLSVLGRHQGNSELDQQGIGYGVVPIEFAN